MLMRSKDQPLSAFQDESLIRVFGHKSYSEKRVLLGDFIQSAWQGMKLQLQSRDSFAPASLVLSTHD
jgi:hypothetical protein